MGDVILLNSDYSFLGTINWKKAMRLVAKEKVEVLKTTKKLIFNSKKTWEFYIPRILRMINLVRKVFKQKVPYSKQNIFYRDNFICQYCGIKEPKMTIDHVIPKSKGGKSNFENCVTSCLKCNLTKNDKTPKEANMFIKRKPFQPTVMEFINIKMKIIGMDNIIKEVWNS